MDRNISRESVVKAPTYHIIPQSTISNKKKSASRFSCGRRAFSCNRLKSHIRKIHQKTKVNWAKVGGGGGGGEGGDGKRSCKGVVV